MSLVFDCLEAAGVDVFNQIDNSGTLSKVCTEKVNGGTRYFIIDKTGKTASTLNRFEYNIESFDWDLLADIDTKSQYRGRGLATTLIQSAYNDSAKSHKGVYLLVRDANDNAIRLYKKLGVSDHKKIRLGRWSLFSYGKG